MPPTVVRNGKRPAARHSAAGVSHVGDFAPSHFQSDGRERIIHRLAGGHEAGGGGSVVIDLVGIHRAAASPGARR